ncbi:hypothetical protein OsI_12063 [Oryza sativa Indica Group]|uniref:chitinase n=1 Tax=Oryza sativa subsp. indica TaxID=39946 RepID=A2XI15_ORYSI|nr:hypothetical protein OsI_12063 [Oryza sativa Indica Group]
MRALAVVAMVATAFLAAAVHAEQCGSQAGGAVCPNCLCCSQFGWCGSTSDYCGAGCQSQCSAAGCGGGGPTPPSGGGGSGVASIVSRSLFDQMLLHRNDAACPASNFYTYDAFVAAASAFPGFAAAGGDADTNKREVDDGSAAGDGTTSDEGPEASHVHGSDNGATLLAWEQRRRFRRDTLQLALVTAPLRGHGSGGGLRSGGARWQNSGGGKPPHSDRSTTTDLGSSGASAVTTMVDRS